MSGGGLGPLPGLAGATADVHSFDLHTGEWSALEPQGEPPSPRAAHAATAVGSMVVVQVRPVELLAACHHSVGEGAED